VRAKVKVRPGGRRGRRIGVGSSAADIAAKAQLRCDHDTLLDVLIGLPHDSYLRLVHEQGWSIEKFETWLADVIERVCLA
jgi:hypothetical protein